MTRKTTVRPTPLADPATDAAPAVPPTAAPVAPPTETPAVALTPNPQIAVALSVGARANGGHRGLVLRDAGQGWAQALTAFNNAYGSGPRYAMPSSGFWVEAWTPLSWIEQQSSNAAKEYRQLTEEDLDADMRAPVFRVIVHPDTPTEVTAAGMVGTSAVQHVVLRCAKRKTVIQPLAVVPFVEEAQNAMGAKVVFQGVQATFPLSGLAAVHGPLANQEFFITVIGAGSEEKSFRVQTEAL